MGLYDDFAADWQSTKETLEAQLDRIQSDPVFPKFDLSPAEREKIASGIARTIADYEVLLMEYANACGPKGERRPEA
jgi:hypothetical protein